jgi:hypothetical protein
VTGRFVRAREQAALAVIAAALLCAGVAHVARGDGCLSAADAANALRCDGRLAALAAATTLCGDATSGPEAGGEVSRAAGDRIHCAARAAGATGSPALHTATRARPLHRRLHHGALAMRRAGHRHTTPELHAHREAMRPLGTPPVPAAPARESHPRASALPVLVRLTQHVPSSGGGRLAAALPGAGWTLPVSAAAVASEEDVRVPDAGHDANEARGPPEGERLTLIPPALARSPSFLPRALSSRPTSHSPVPARSPLEADRDAHAANAPAEPTSNPGPRAFPFVVPAPPRGGADARRMESATACLPRLSAGGRS